MHGVLGTVVRGQVSVVALHAGVVVLVAEGVLDRVPHLAARNGIAELVGLAERRQSKNQRHQSSNHYLRMDHGVSPRSAPKSLLKNYCKTCFGYKSGDALGSPDYYKSILGHSGAKCFSASGHQTPFSTNS